jgi:hypothetical protein
MQRLVMQPLLEKAQIGAVVYHRDDALRSLLGVAQHRGIQIYRCGLAISQAQRDAGSKPRILTDHQVTVISFHDVPITWREQLA